MTSFLRIEDPADERIDDYLALNDPARRRRVERAGGYFVVEGVTAVERLLATPGWSVRSLLLLDAAATRLGEQLRDLDAPTYLADRDVLRAVAGFDLHRGALAAVERPAERPVADVVARAQRMLVTEGLNDHENLGALFRNAAAFGVDAVLLDPTTADPLYRRSVRVSMGHILQVPFARTAALPLGLCDVRAAGATVVALTPADDAVAVRDVPALVGPAPIAVVVGAEGPGLTAATLAAADIKARIPMAREVDSLNVATAAAVALSHLVPDP